MKAPWGAAKPPSRRFRAIPSVGPARDFHYCYYYFSDGTTGWILGSVGPDRQVDFFSGPEGRYANRSITAVHRG
ncbi:hypothetical protein HS125_07325 [bacterium]|nr:hypothetical protein [bacterium]